MENKEKNEEIKEYGQVELDSKDGKKIHLLSIIGEIEGHENLASTTKTTKYEHVLPKLAEIENDDSIGGLLVIINTVGGDVNAVLLLPK